MPLPWLLVAGAGVVGAGAAIEGAEKMKDANETMKVAKSKQATALKEFEKATVETTQSMDLLGDLEFNILSSFEEFANIIEKIQRRPEFELTNVEGVALPKCKVEEIKQVSVGASTFLGSLGGAVVGITGGYAAAGATISTVSTFGTASTGIAIADLSGAAAMNATLATLGGGAIASGGGGIVAGKALLSGGVVPGVGLFVGGIVFNIIGSNLSEKADEAYTQACKIEGEVQKVVSYLDELKSVSTDYYETLCKVVEHYRKRLQQLKYIVNSSKKTNWDDFSYKKKLITENTVLLVGLLYKMCQVKLVRKSGNDKDINKVNRADVRGMIGESNKVLKIAGLKVKHSSC